jgi:hypothetical protein
LESFSVTFLLDATYPLKVTFYLDALRTREMNTSFVAPPGYRVVYTIEWYDVWVEGRILPISSLQAGEKTEISYRAKTGMESKIPNPIPEACGANPTDTLIPFPVPTLEITDTPTLIFVPSVETETPVPDQSPLPSLTP